MARPSHKIYVRFRVLKALLRGLGIVLITAAALAILLFFGLRQYAVYTPDGVRLEIPWLDD